MALTASFALLTAFLANRWEERRAARDVELRQLGELRELRRSTYVRYIASAQRVFDLALDHNHANRGAPTDPAALAATPPGQLMEATIAHETLRIEVVLAGGDAVRTALNAYSASLRSMWPETAAGRDTSLRAENSAAYHDLVDAMRAELTPR